VFCIGFTAMCMNIWSKEECMTPPRFSWMKLTFPKLFLLVIFIIFIFIHIHVYVEQRVFDLWCIGRYGTRFCYTVFLKNLRYGYYHHIFRRLTFFLSIVSIVFIKNEGDNWNIIKYLNNLRDFYTTCIFLPYFPPQINKIKTSTFLE
jgi:hypothetical protein